MICRCWIRCRRWSCPRSSTVGRWYCWPRSAPVTRCREMYQRRWSDLGVVRVQIDPLAEAECGVLLGRAVGGPVATKAAGRFHTLSGGNPLHLKELLRAAIDDGTFTPVAGVWQLAAGPVGSTYLTELVADHLRRLTPAEAGLIRRIAVCQPLELADFSPDDAEQLDNLERRGMIRVDPAETGFAVRLAHPGHAEILTGQTSRLEARRMLL